MRLQRRIDIDIVDYGVIQVLPPQSPLMLSVNFWP